MYDLLVKFTSLNNLVLILYDESASAIWSDLKTRFHQKNGPHIFNLRKILMNLIQDNQTVSMYFTKLKTIWEELTNYRPSCTCHGCTCEGVKKLQEHHHMEYIMVFLMGLSDSYSHIRGSILLMDPMLEVNRVETPQNFIFSLVQLDYVHYVFMCIFDLEYMLFDDT